VSTDKQEAAATWAIVVGAAVLFGSLLLTWSHQFSRGFLAYFGAFAALARSPRNLTAWQVYSAADVVLAVVALGLVGVALFGGRVARRVMLTVTAVAFVFVLHALIAPPSNGALIYDPATRGYAANSPAAGVGETVALLGLLVALVGLALSLAGGGLAAERAPAVA
jgi:hypothetical protein